MSSKKQKGQEKRIQKQAVNTVARKKKMRLFWAFIIVVVVCIIANYAFDFYVYKRDRNVADMYIEQARLIASKTGDPIALQVVVLLENANVAIVDGDSLKSMESRSGSQGLKIVIVRNDEDLFREPLADLRFVGSVAAVYSRLLNAIVMKDNRDSISDIDNGFMILHEGKHAYNRLYAYRGKIDFTKSEIAYEEALTHEYIYKLMGMFGGDSYKKLLEREKVRMITEIKASNFDFNPYPLELEYDTLLDEAFGTARSLNEKLNRKMYLETDAAFRVTDEYYDGDKQLQKARVINQIYSDLGMYENR